MEFLKRLARKINSNVVLRNLVLAACAIVIFIFVVGAALNLFTRHGQVREVPDFKGMTEKEAKKEASRHGSLIMEVSDSIYLPQYEGGVIVAQLPLPGAKVKSGRRVLVTINSYNQRKAVIPYVAGYSLRQAKNNLELAKFEIERLVFRTHNATNNVIEQRLGDKIIGPGNTLEAELGTGITLIVGLAAEDAAPTQVPRVVGYSLRDAKSRLWEAGFNVGKVTFDKGIDALNQREAKVYLQSPAVGARQSYGTEVNISITLNEELIANGATGAEKAAAAATRAAAAEAAARQAESGSPQDAQNNGQGEDEVWLD